MKKRTVLLLALQLTLGTMMKAQFTPPMFNTASQPSSYTGHRAYGAQDVAWTVAQTIGGSFSTPPTTPASYVKAVVINAATTGWWDPHPTQIPNAGWITFPNTAPGESPAYHTHLGGLHQWYKLEFYICCDQQFCLDLEMWADNRIQEVYVNTNTNSGPGYWQNTTPYSHTEGDFEGYWEMNKVSKNFCGNWRLGLNTIIIHVISDGGDPSADDLAGLLVNCTNVTPCHGIIYFPPSPPIEDNPGDDTPLRRAKPSTVAPITNPNGTPALDQNVPNPYDESTVISYEIPRNAESAELVLSDAKGTVVRSFTIATRGPGSMRLTADDLKAGFYTYALLIDGQTAITKKLIKE